jgi:superfamily I DNA and/or RNA helicase
MAGWSPSLHTNDIGCDSYDLAHADHEDIGFFDKKVENVQGDERDLIIFSTTFGRNERGVFRRNFGVLGQQGGRRRLNVAVTRAKKKVIVATSIPTEKCPTCFRPIARR